MNEITISVIVADGRGGTRWDQFPGFLVTKHFAVVQDVDPPYDWHVTHVRTGRWARPEHLAPFLEVEEATAFAELLERAPVKWGRIKGFLSPRVRRRLQRFFGAEQRLRDETGVPEVQGA